jgi:hypothetical protein
MKKSIYKCMKFDEYIENLPRAYINENGDLEIVKYAKYDGLICSDVYDGETAKYKYGQCDYLDVVLYKAENSWNRLRVGDETIPYIAKWRLLNEEEK